MERWKGRAPARGAMKNIMKLIDRTGGLEHLKEHPIRIAAHGAFMRLTVEYIGVGPRGCPLISVAHYFEQNGDLMRDPEMTFEVLDGEFHPVSCTMDPVGLYQEAVFKGEAGGVLIKPRLTAELKAIARIWDRNIRDQGYMDEVLK